MEVLVVGAGAMGRWAGGTLGTAFDVAFADRDPGVASTAADAVGGRSVGLDTTETFEVVCLAVPMGAVADAVAAHAGRASRAMIDVTGVMAAPVAAMREHLPERERVSLHPLFAPENAPGNVAVVRDAPGPAADRALDAIADAGNHTFGTDPEEHDTAMETVQAGAHTAILAYALAAADVREEFATPVSRGLDDLVGTVTGGTPRVYREIQESFEGAEAVADAARRVADADGDAFERVYDDAGRHARGHTAGEDGESGDDAFDPGRSDRDAGNDDRGADNADYDGGSDERGADNADYDGGSDERGADNADYDGGSDERGADNADYDVGNDHYNAGNDDYDVRNDHYNAGNDDYDAGGGE